LSFERLEKFILDKMSRYRMPGLSIAVVRGGEIVYAKGFGSRIVSTARAGVTTFAATAMYLEKGILYIGLHIHQFIS
jgi:CubicO group peptidase (beta-lactamase class C family)